MTATPATTKQEHHWADTDAETWAAEYFARIAKSGSWLARLQLRAHQHFYGALPFGYIGDLPSSAEVTRAGEQGENVELKVNWIRAHENARHNIIVAPRLTWGAQAVNTDSRSMVDASRGASILEAEWKQGPWEKAAIDAQMGAGIYGEEFIFPYWNQAAGEALGYIDPQPAVAAAPGAEALPPTPENPDGVPAQPPVEAKPEVPGQVVYEGDIVCHQVASWNAFCDPTATSWEASAWKAARVVMDRWDLIAQFPTMKEKILDAATLPSVTQRGPNGVNTTITPDPAKCFAHLFFHERTPGLPLGLQAIALNDKCVLEFQPLERCYFKPPIHQFSGGVLKGCPRGYTDFWEAMAGQDLATNIQSSLATNIVAFAKQMVVAEEGTNVNPDQLGNGPTMLYIQAGKMEPKPLMLHQSNEGAFEHLRDLKGDQRMMLGLNDVAMGEAPTGTPNAQAWALLATAGITANSGGQRSFVNGVRNVGQSILAIWKEKVDIKRKTSVVGVHGAAVPKQEEWDKSDLEPLGDVTVEIANPLAQTAAGRLQIEQLYSDRGFVQTPEQLEMLIETGSLQPLTQVLRDELIYIAWENEQILKGICPPVMITDSQQMHIREHKGPTFSAAARENPAIIAAANKHIQMHIQQAMDMQPQIAQLLGQAAVQQPAPPMPGAGGPAKPPAALEQPGAPAQSGVKLPSPPRNPLTGAQAAPPGIAP